MARESFRLMDRDGSTNAVRLLSRAEAMEYRIELAMRWIACPVMEIVESEDPPNYRFDFEAYKLVPLKGDTE